MHGDLPPYLLSTQDIFYKCKKKKSNKLGVLALAENYYTADYPDEELAWDDMWDRNPYRFVNDNASDREEFGTEDEDEFLDDVWEKSRSSGGDGRDAH